MPVVPGDLGLQQADSQLDHAALGKQDLHALDTAGEVEKAAVRMIDVEIDEKIEAAVDAVLADSHMGIVVEEQHMELAVRSLWE